MSEKHKSAFYDYAEPTTSSPTPPRVRKSMQNVPATRSHFATITRSALDRVNMINFSEIEVAAIHEVVNALVFRRQYHILPPCGWVSISFHGGDKLKILNSPPSELVDDMIAAFVTDIQRHEVTAERAKIKFRGFPWRSLGHDGEDEAQMKLLTLLEVVEKSGFTLLTFPLESMIEVIWVK
ncbi:hypothetical protein FSPOR_4893 [Fusarium sporotrichioides]|uniref:Uncharacterized protein n=1 Tax=Fusarium sporotrichioides TaxID=5514 RepID=A0A395S9V9_FUSSP|nr:hypothetical protein FSPOR_4893 [Fusarium sporotrichioides]